MLIRPDIPTRIKINLDIPASATRSNWKKPIKPQLMAPMMLRIRVIFWRMDKDINRTSYEKF